MNDTIKVHVIAFGDRKSLQLQWRDPDSGLLKTKSAKTTVRRDAEREAGRLEKELREGTFFRPGVAPWEQFWERYDEEVLSGFADTTAKKKMVVRRAVEKHLHPQKLSDLTEARISYLISELRKTGCTESTIDGYLAHLIAALQWAVDMKVIRCLPVVKRPQRAKGRRGPQRQAKGRPITGEEFDRLLGKAEAVVGAEAAPSFKDYLWGLWNSGLRLAESMELWWDRDDRLCVDFSGKRPMLRIPAELEKGNQDRMLPMAPEFAEQLLKIPEAERTGRVFKLVRRCHEGERLSDARVGKLISEMGRKAGVKVWTHPTSGKVKYATAHDLRRSFGFKWSSRVMPVVLQQLMRHESIDTTMEYYVGRNAQETAETIWAAHPATNGFANTQPNDAEIPAES